MTNDIEAAARALVEAAWQLNSDVRCAMEGKWEALRSALARPRDEGVGEGHSGLPVAYQSSSIGAPPWSGPTPTGAGEECLDRCGGTHIVKTDSDGQVCGTVRDELERAKAAPPAPAAPKCGEPRPVTPDDGGGALAAKRERCAKVCDRKAAKYALWASETKAPDLATAYCYYAIAALSCAREIRALRDERGHDEPDPRGEDREAIEAARRGGGRGE